MPVARLELELPTDPAERLLTIQWETLVEHPAAVDLGSVGEASVCLREHHEDDYDATDDTDEARNHKHHASGRRLRIASQVLSKKNRLSRLNHANDPDNSNNPSIDIATAAFSKTNNIINNSTENNTGSYTTPSVYNLGTDHNNSECHATRDPSTSMSTATERGDRAVSPNHSNSDITISLIAPKEQGQDSAGSQSQSNDQGQGSGITQVTRTLRKNELSGSINTPSSEGLPQLLGLIEEGIDSVSPGIVKLHHKVVGEGTNKQEELEGLLETRSVNHHLLGVGAEVTLALDKESAPSVGTERGETQNPPGQLDATADPSDHALSHESLQWDRLERDTRRYALQHPLTTYKNTNSSLSPVSSSGALSLSPNGYASPQPLLHPLGIEGRVNMHSTGMLTPGSLRDRSGDNLSVSGSVADSTKSEPTAYLNAESRYVSPLTISLSRSIMSRGNVATT